MAVELPTHNTFGESLEKAAKDSKININTLGMVSLLRADSTLVIAPIREFDVTPASELKKGVNSAFAYIDSPDRNVPAGYYTLRVTADAPQIGEVPGTLEYVDSRGQTANKSSVQLDIKSLTLPHPPALPHTVINVESRRVAHAGDLALTALRDTVIVCCPNGYCWFEKQ